MNKIVLSVLALAALSTASFAAERRSYELRDVVAFDGATATTTETAPLISADHGMLTAFGRQSMLAAERGDGGR